MSERTFRHGRERCAASGARSAGVIGGVVPVPRRARSVDGTACSRHLGTKRADSLWIERNRGRISSGRGRRGGDKDRASGAAGADERRRPDPQPWADPAERARRLPHARCQGRGALRRQGQIAEEAAARLHQAGGAERPAAAHGGADPRARGGDHGERRRGAAARVQPDQAAPAAVQHRAARRQVVPLHLRRQGHRSSSRFRASAGTAGRKRKDSDYFGPFASSGAVNETLAALLRAFPLRSCPDSIFDNRTRPCLQYQIKRCSAPCVGRIGATDYGQLVEQTREFLAGRSDAIQEQLKAAMADASAAPRIRAGGRDPRPPQGARAHHLAPGHQRQLGRRCRRGRAGAGRRAGLRAGVLLSGRPQLRQSRLLSEPRARRRGRRSCWRRSSGSSTTSAAPPRLILLSHAPASQELLAEALAVRAGRKVRAAAAAARREAPAGRAGASATPARRSRASSPRAAPGQAAAPQLAERLGLAEPPSRIEVYDNSHIMGTNALGRDDRRRPGGSDKSAYRKFTIRSKELTPGDDYAMMREVLARRFARLQREDPERQSGQWPDLVLIDGGAGQLGGGARDARRLRRRRGAGGRRSPRGPDRDAGRETLHLPEQAADQAGPARPGAVLPAAAARRGAPLRDHQPPGEAGQGESRRRRSTGCRASAPSARGRCSAISARCARSRRPVCSTSSAVPGISKAVARAVYDAFHEAS